MSEHIVRTNKEEKHRVLGCFSLRFNIIGTFLMGWSRPDWGQLVKMILELCSMPTLPLAMKTQHKWGRVWTSDPDLGLFCFGVKWVQIEPVPGIRTPGNDGICLRVRGYVCLGLSVCVDVWGYVCLCVCQRERDRDGDRYRETDREEERECALGVLRHWQHSMLLWSNWLPRDLMESSSLNGQVWTPVLAGQ